EPRVRYAGAAQDRHQRDTFGREARRRDPEERRERRRDVEDLRRIIAAHARGDDLGMIGRDQDQRDVEQRLPERELVTHLALLAEQLAVVAQHDQQGPLETAELREPRDQLGELRVEIRELAVVEIGLDLELAWRELDLPRLVELRVHAHVLALLRGQVLR